MKESEVESDFEQDIFKPKIDEFANFSKFIKSLEDQNLSFALVSDFMLFHFLFIDHFF